MSTVVYDHHRLPHAEQKALDLLLNQKVITTNGGVLYPVHFRPAGVISWHHGVCGTSVGFWSEYTRKITCPVCRHLVRREPEDGSYPPDMEDYVPLSKANDIAWLREQYRAIRARMPA